MNNSVPKYSGRVLTIAGLDPSGGAGLLADIKTISALGGFGCGVATALTVQNTVGVEGVEPVSTALIIEQLNSVLDDIDISAIKLGMLYDENIIIAISSALNAMAKKYLLVLDPVIKSSSGKSLLSDNGVTHLREKLLPLTTLITPNIFEAETLTGMKIKTQAQMQTAAKKLCEMGVENAFITGGHLDGDKAIDVLYGAEVEHVFEEKKLDAANSHGTGCALSSAIATYLSQGDKMLDACTKAKKYVYEAIRTAPNIGAGNGPINHGVKP